ncbi:uncharacterized protein C12orf50 homolog [Calypte anna]|uniref:uncharacterized protein C12orf50 homolog n=1 Tax=Calypte anna TaxID=9244 RepID=UPI0011C3D57F|nr:uncharacterized protein C12orf50 homolog [Calypte anna]
MATAGNDRPYHFYSPTYTQQKSSNVFCFWETKPSGCLRIACAFHHSKPRYINGLFLPPNNNSPLQQGVQEMTLHPAYCQDSPRNSNNLLPIHPPVIINLNDTDDEEDDEEEDEEDDEEEDYVSNCVPKTAADIEEERALKEICSISGEYYRIQNPFEYHSPKLVSSPGEKERSFLEGTEQELQKGDGNTIPSTFNNTKREGESSGRRVPTGNNLRGNIRYFIPSETNSIEQGRNHHCKEIRQKKWISKDPRNSPNTVTGKGIHCPDAKVKPAYQQKGPRNNDRAAPSEPQRSVYVVYRSVVVTQEANFNGSTDKSASGTSNAPTWRTRNTHAKTFFASKTAIQVQEVELAPRAPVGSLQPKTRVSLFWDNPTLLQHHLSWVNQELGMIGTICWFWRITMLLRSGRAALKLPVILLPSKGALLALAQPPLAAWLQLMKRNVPAAVGGDPSSLPDAPLSMGYRNSQIKIWNSLWWVPPLPAETGTTPLRGHRMDGCPKESFPAKKMPPHQQQ